MSGNRGRNASGGQAVKIVVTGPFAAGKTTLIRSISEITVLSTEKDVTDETAVRKAETTVAMDFGRITIDHDLVLHLFGTPGQSRFDFMWEIISEGMLGYVMLLDGSRPDSIEEALPIRQAFARMTTVPFVVAVNRVDDVSADLAHAIRERLELGPKVEIVACNATERTSVKGVLLALLHSLLDSLESADVRAVQA
jgi:small GTP-binding protein